MDVVLLRAGGDELAVGAPFQRDVAAAPAELARRQGDLADAPHRDAAVMRGGDAAAVLAEVDRRDRARVRPELAHLARLVDHQRHLADRCREGAVAAMGGELVDPLALLVGDFSRAAVGCDAQQAAIVAAAQEAVAVGIGDQRQHRAVVQGLRAAPPAPSRPPAARARGRRPAPKATVLPSRLKAQATPARRPRPSGRAAAWTASRG